MSSRTRSALLVAVALAAGCEQPAESVSREDAPVAMSETLCALIDECECTRGDSCKKLVQTRLADFMEEATNLGLKYDGECMAALLSQLEEVGCAWDSGQQCSCRPYYGFKREGGTCEIYGTKPVPGLDLQLDSCGPGLACDGWSCKPLCSGDEESDPSDSSEIGEDCAPGDCEGGAFCNDARVCEERRDRGEKCSAFSQCKTNYCPNGTCQPRPGLGEPCIGWCGEGSVCMDQVCQPDVCRALPP